jgi:hypothetical protein
VMIFLRTVSFHALGSCLDPYLCPIPGSLVAKAQSQRLCRGTRFCDAPAALLALAPPPPAFFQYEILFFHHSFRGPPEVCMCRELAAHGCSTAGCEPQSVEVSFGPSHAGKVYCGRFKSKGAAEMVNLYVGHDV